MDDLVDLEEPQYNPATMATSSLMATKAPRLKRPWVLLTLGISLVVAISIITDISRPITKTQDARDQNAAMKAINADVAPCVFALKESLALHRQAAQGLLSQSDLKQVPGLLVGDRTACSFASQPIYDLTNNIQVRDTRAGKSIDHLRSLVTLWATGSALQAIVDVSILFKQPTNQRILQNLTRQVTELTRQRQQSRAYAEEASKILGIAIIEPKLPILRPFKN